MRALLIALRTLKKDSSGEPLLTPFVMLIEGIAMIALAANTGKSVQPANLASIRKLVAVRSVRRMWLDLLKPQYRLPDRLYLFR
ncbi:MAG: hypothetical protein ACJ74Z_06875 [Bryobacteraceae bacterium]